MTLTTKNNYTTLTYSKKENPSILTYIFTVRARSRSTNCRSRVKSAINWDSIPSWASSRAFPPTSQWGCWCESMWWRPRQADSGRLNMPSGNIGVFLRPKMIFSWLKSRSTSGNTVWVDTFPYSLFLSILPFFSLQPLNSTFVQLWHLNWRHFSSHVCFSAWCSILKSLLSYAPDFFSPQLFFVVAEPFFTQLLHIYISLQLLLQKKTYSYSYYIYHSHPLLWFCYCVTSMKEAPKALLVPVDTCGHILNTNFYVLFNLATLGIYEISDCGIARVI